MHTHAPEEPEAPKRTGKSPLGNVPWKALAYLAAGLGLLIGGLSGLLSAQGTIKPQYPQVSVTAILEAAEAGELAQVTLNSVTATSTYSLGTATLGKDPGVGALTDETGEELAAGEKVNFYLPAALQPQLAQALLDTRTPLWVGPGRTSAAGVANLRGGNPSVGTQDPSTANGEATGGSGDGGNTDSPETTAPEPQDRPAWFTFLMMGIIVAGVILIARGGLLIVVSRAEQATKADTRDSQVPTTRFSDVAGADEAVEQMRELVDYLDDPEKYHSIGAKLPKGALLVGPPGTGKTLLARALAGEANVEFFSATGSQFVEMYVGVGAKRIRELYSKARKSGKAIVFIDEIDAIARKRSESHQANSNTEAENTLIALLTELDGFATGSSVITIAATNRPDILDPALVRPGRLDRKIEVPLPDRRGRQKILEVHSNDVALDPHADIARIAKRTPGFSGAQLANVINEAALEAVRGGKETVDNTCLDAAVAHVAMGRARTSALVTEHDRLVTAWHEAGHTASALLLADADPPVAVSIVPRGPAGGVTWMSGSDEQFLTRSKAHARLVVALSGRAAEQLLLNGEYTQGAAGDLESATDIALLMATRYGMTPLGLASRSQHLGGTTTKDVTEVVEDLLAQAHHEATKLLRSRRELVEAIANELLDKEDLDSEDLKRIAHASGVTPAGTPTPLPEVPTPAARRESKKPEKQTPKAPRHSSGKVHDEDGNAKAKDRPRPQRQGTKPPVMAHARALTRSLVRALKPGKRTRAPKAS